MWAELRAWSRFTSKVRDRFFKVENQLESNVDFARLFMVFLELRQTQDLKLINPLSDQGELVVHFSEHSLFLQQLHHLDELSNIDAN